MNNLSNNKLDIQNKSDNLKKSIWIKIIYWICNMKDWWYTMTYMAVYTHWWVTKRLRWRLMTLGGIYYYYYLICIFYVHYIASSFKDALSSNHFIVKCYDYALAWNAMTYFFLIKIVMVDGMQNNELWNIMTTLIHSSMEL